jgi:hypothetical protein
MDIAPRIHNSWMQCAPFKPSADEHARFRRAAISVGGNLARGRLAGEVLASMRKHPHYGTRRASLPFQWISPKQGSSIRSTLETSPRVRSNANARTGAPGNASLRRAAAAKSVRPRVMTSSTNTKLAAWHGNRSTSKDS